VIQIGSDIRRLSHDLYPPVLQHAGLPEALQNCCEELSAACGMAVTCEADENAGDLPLGAALTLLRIVQECPANAAKHAQATRIAVRLTRSDGSVSLIVSDDGVGFDGSRSEGSDGLGLIMMRDRANHLSGTFDIDSAPGHGTTIRVHIPVGNHVVTR